MLDDLAQLNAKRLEATGDPEIATRIAQYELAYRMQSSVPELMRTADEPASTFQLYGDEAKTPGTFAATGPLGEGRKYHTATLLQNGNVLIAGGGTSSAELTGDGTSSAELYE